MSFDQAKTLMQSQGIKTRKGFNEWKQAGNRSKDFPSHPEQVYTNEWRGWRDFLGTKWMSFDQAKTFIQRQGIRTREQFQEWSKSEQRPKDFPSNPHKVYTNEWRGWGDFLGTGNISVRNRDWMSFQDAKTLMQRQGIRTREQFQEWSKSEQRPKNFPSTPHQTYKNKWRGWGDFLGTGNISTSKRKWMSFQDAKALMQSQGIKTSTEFNEWKKAGKRPKDFPSNPSETYKNKWRGWGDFLGTGNISTRNRKWMSFQDAKALMQSQGIKTITEFNEWKKAGNRPKDFPSHPEQTYKDKWRGWSNFLGTGNIVGGRKKEWMSFQDAKALMQSQGIKTREQFQEWSKSEQRPKNFPSTPHQVYTNEWRGWGDFLGTGNISTENSKQTSFEENSTLTQSRVTKPHIKPKEKKRTRSRVTRTRIKPKEKKRTRTGNKSKNIPSRPDQTNNNEHTDQGNPPDTKNNEQTSFDEIKAFLQRLGVRTHIESEEEEQASSKPEKASNSPDEASKDEQVDSDNFLESETTWMSFNEAKEYVRSLNFENHKDFIDWLKSSDRPENFPPNPQKVYSEWISLKDFLSTKEYMTYEEAKTFVQQLGITNQRDFFEERKNNSDIFPENFPPNPKAFYTNTGEWIDWNDFLGLTNKSYNRSNNSGENSQIERDELGQEDIFTDAEKRSEWEEDAEI